MKEKLFCCWYDGEKHYTRAVTKEVDSYVK